MAQVQYTTHQQSGDILLNANESPWNLPEELLEEFKESLSSIDINRYPEDSCEELCEAYAKVVGVDKEQILAGNGSDQHLGFLIGNLVDKGQKLVTLSEDFGMYDYYASNYDVKVVKYQIQTFDELDLDHFIDFIKQEKPQMVLFSNPNNPTGRYLDPEKIEYLAQRISCALVIDEAYIEFAPQSSISLVDRYPHLYITRTLSKAYGLAGARIGFLIAGKETMDKIRPYHVPYAVNSMSCKLGTIVLKHADLFELRIKTIQIQRAYIEQWQFHRCSIHSSFANFFLVKTKDIEALKQAFEQANIMIRTYKDKDYCRITIGNKEENEKVKAVLEAFDKEETCA